MSCYEWERGSVTLPSASVAGVRKTLVDAANRQHEKAYLLSRAWLQKQGTRDPERLREALWGSTNPQEVVEVIQTLLWMAERDMKPVPLPTHEHVDQSWPRATNRTQLFELGGAVAAEARISFTGRVVNWEVEENNHACQRARAHPVAQALFGALNRVVWTRGTGGQIVGNNEYNRDNTYEGGGGNFVVETFGPRTKAQLVSAVSRW